MDEEWEVDYAHIARQVMATAGKLADMHDAPNAEPLDADEFEAALAELHRLERQLQRHFWNRPGHRRTKGRG